MGNARIRVRRGTAAEWTASNPVLALAEAGLERDTRRLKFGDGSTAWNDLPYMEAAVAWAAIAGKPSTFPPSPKRAVTSGTTSGTQTPTADTADIYLMVALTGAITLAAPSGSPSQGQQLLLRIKDNGTARAITWSTSAGGYRAVGGTLPATTSPNKTLYAGCIYNATDGLWDVVAISQES